MSQAVSVSEFVQLIDEGLAAFDGIVVEGEVAEFKIIHNKWVTFQLKDDRSTVGCFMTIWQYKTEIEDGMLIRAEGRPRLREKGFFSFVVQRLAPTGEGALKRAFELLKEKLSREGLFDSTRKRSLPRWPQHIALITSRDAAAYSDFLKVLAARIGGLTISFLHTQVQGEDAARQIIAAVEYANTDLKALDGIVLVRGGGSLEDLRSFNDEAVVRAVAASRTPTIVGVGHERDVTLAELAADVRASTPSNAAELLVRSRDEISLEVVQLRDHLAMRWRDALVRHTLAIRRQVDTLRRAMQETHDHIHRNVVQLRGMRQRFLQTAASRSRQVDGMERLLISLSPQTVLQRGYSITRNAAGRLVKRPEDVAPGEIITTQLTKGSLRATVE
jgi:exodeoxyribonuclease VII large subunit